MDSIKTRARIAGALYVSASLIGIIGLLIIPSMLIVKGNATATANNIAAHESLFRWKIVCYLLGGVLWLFVPLALYRLLSGVNKTLAVLMVILGSLMQTPLFVINTVTDAAALQLVRGADFLSVFDKPQRDALAMLCLRLHAQIEVAGLIFAGLWLFPFGVLVYKSRFLPRLLGMAGGGVLRLAWDRFYRIAAARVSEQSVLDRATFHLRRVCDHVLAFDKRRESGKQVVATAAS